MNGAYHRHYLPFFLAWLLKITILDRFLHERAKQWQKEVPAVYSFSPPSFFSFSFDYTVWRTTPPRRAASNAVIVRLFPYHSLTPSPSSYCTPPPARLVGHIAENCTSQERLCYNCRKPGHESSTCPEPRSVSAKQCYSCGGIGHIQAECPTLRLQGSNQKCYVRSSLFPISPPTH
jgi:hypothetical protein